MTRSQLSRLCIPLIALTAACGSDPAEPSGSGGSSNGGSQNGGSGGRAPRPEACPLGPGRETQADEVRVGTVSGRIVDERGEPTSSGLVQICGKNLCINADVPESGVLAQTVDDDFDAPACKFGNGKAWGKLAIPLGEGDTDLGTLVAVALPAFEEGAALTPGDAASSGDVTLTLAADAAVEIDTLTYEDESQFGFRAARLPDTELGLFEPEFAAVYLLAPVETRICPSPALSLKNSAELAAGAEVELFILGLDVLELWAPYAGWQKVGEGSVSSDGASIDFPDGLPLLTAIGIREKP